MSPEMHSMITQISLARDMVRDLRDKLAHMIIGKMSASDPQLMKCWNLASELLLALETLAKKCSENS